MDLPLFHFGDSIKKTSRVLILHEDCMVGGFGSELSALISENCFEFLDAPIKRLASLNTPVPFAKELENNFLPKDKLKDELISLISY